MQCDNTEVNEREHFFCLLCTINEKSSSSPTLLLKLTLVNSFIHIPQILPFSTSFGNILSIGMTKEENYMKKITNI